LAASSQQPQTTNGIINHPLAIRYSTILCIDSSSQIMSCTGRESQKEQFDEECIYNNYENKTTTGVAFRFAVKEVSSQYDAAPPSKRLQIINELHLNSGQFLLKRSGVWTPYTTAQAKEKIRRAICRANNGPKVIGTRRVCIGHTPNGMPLFSECEVYSSWYQRPTPIPIKLSNGGSLTLYTKVVKHTDLNALVNEMSYKGILRQYSIQDHLAPRLSCALHHDATHDATDTDTPGPGVLYSTSQAKARSFDAVPSSKKVIQAVNECVLDPSQKCTWHKHWTGCVTYLYYRDSEDSISWHADNRQGERQICCLMASQHSYLGHKSEPTRIGAEFVTK
jgi:hypothetical protein